MTMLERVTSAQRPAAWRGRLRVPRPSPRRRLRIDQRAQVFESIRGHEAAGRQFPQRVFHFAGQPFGFAHQIREEGRAAGRRARRRLRAPDATGPRSRPGRMRDRSTNRHLRARRRKSARCAWAGRGARHPARPDAAKAAPRRLRRRGRDRRDSPGRTRRCAGFSTLSSHADAGISKPCNWRTICNTPSAP